MSNKTDIDKIKAKVSADPKPRKAKDLMDGDFALCLAYLEIEKALRRKVNSLDNYQIGYSDGFIESGHVILEMLDVATLGDIDWEDIKKAPMRK